MNLYSPADPLEYEGPVTASQSEKKGTKSITSAVF